MLGRGGQGTVYLGQNSSGIKVAVKVINAQAADDQNARRRFSREAEAAGSVAAFCTARVLDAGIADGRPYIVSEFIAGPALDRLVQQDGVRSGSGLERLAVATLTALAAIHRAVSRAVRGQFSWASRRSAELKPEGYGGGVGDGLWRLG